MTALEAYLFINLALYAHLLISLHLPVACQPAQIISPLSKDIRVDGIRGNCRSTETRLKRSRKMSKVRFKEILCLA
jgi:hypothetical protein